MREYLQPELLQWMNNSFWPLHQNYHVKFGQGPSEIKYQLLQERPSSNTVHDQSPITHHPQCINPYSTYYPVSCFSVESGGSVVLFECLQHPHPRLHFVRRRSREEKGSSLRVNLKHVRMSTATNTTVKVKPSSIWDQPEVVLLWRLLCTQGCF